MKQYKLFVLLAALAGTMTAIAQAPAGYYSSLNGKKDADLKTAVYERIHNFTLISSYYDLPRYFQETDLYPGSRRWWDMYSDIPLYAPSFSGLNREHSLPKSWWGGSTTISAYVDLNHLYPSEMKANTAKSNYPLGMLQSGSTPKFDNGVCRVGYPANGQGGGAPYVFEPAPEYRGDFARTYFYMATCYQTLTWKYTYMLTSNPYPTLTSWAVDLLLQWHREDPVSQKEIDRNNAVYNIQNNRNPFIDCPDLAEYIWGNRKGQVYTGQNTDPDVPVGDPELTAPVRGMSLDFGAVAVGKSSSARLFIKGENLRGKLDLAIYSGDKDMFSIPSSSISATLANAANGYWLTVTYKPTSLGEHSSKLSLSEGGITGSVAVNLIGRCEEAPTLTACTATAPSDIEADRYVANWTAPQNEVIDYFVVTRTCYLPGGEVRTEELEAEYNYTEVTGFDASERESYSVQSVRLGFRSPMSNTVFVEHAGVTGVELEMEPMVVQSFEGFLRIICSAPHYQLEIYDPSGRLVRVIPEVDTNTDIYLTPGVYLVRSAAHPAPLKAVVR